MTRNTSTLRDILFDEIENVRNGGEAKRASAVARLAQQILSTANVELRFHEMRLNAEKHGQTLEIGSMDLGNRAIAAVGQTNAAPSVSTGPDGDLPPSTDGSGSATAAS